MKPRMIRSVSQFIDDILRLIVCTTPLVFSRGADVGEGCDEYNDNHKGDEL